MAGQTTFKHFLADDRGAVTVDWTVLSAAAVGMAIATTAVMSDSIDILGSRMDAELRSRNLAQEWVTFMAVHFEPVLQTGFIDEAQAEELYNIADGMMNHDLVEALTAGIAEIEDGTITAEELVQLISMASVAFQRNIVDDAILNHYFGLDGSDPYYMTVADAPTSTGSG
ncbi:hypothetical protein [Hasllibacter sp. MH4015]|uniref:hypothetical protein n=1 Tax=Hasllibacter sp. MH4015 TaxID=2854029 RepID=UPI001CD6859F|nr:hypothetical protein [Hasllibacter sp. MH4015]